MFVTHETCNTCHHANSVTYPDLRRLLGYCSLTTCPVYMNMFYMTVLRRPIDNRIESICHHFMCGCNPGVIENLQIKRD